MRRSPHRFTAVLAAISLASCAYKEAPLSSTRDLEEPVRSRSVGHVEADPSEAKADPPQQEVAQATTTAPATGERSRAKNESAGRNAPKKKAPEATMDALAGDEGLMGRGAGGLDTDDSSSSGGVVGGVVGGQIAPATPAPKPLHAPPPPAGPSGKGVGSGTASNYGTPLQKTPAKDLPSAQPAEPAPEVAEKPRDAADGNSFRAHEANPFVDTQKDRLSTFAIDVDTASYSLMRSYAKSSSLPPPAAVRVEEYVNYFKYRYASPSSGAFSVNLEGAPSPFTRGHHLLRVGVQGKTISRSQRKTAHLTFLVDTSGSMSGADRLELAKQSMKIAVKNLAENDTVAIATYAGSSQLILPSTSASDRDAIYAAIDSLRSGGGTSMGSGMELAYKQAVKKAAGNVVSRVIVLTDGDTNIGPNLSPDSMLESIKKYVSEGVTMTTVGFGMGNYRDDLMEKLADSGNGNCFYVDGPKEAKKVFETQLTGTLEVIAKDVKIQVEFNPAAVAAYRLVGYENRDIADQDFRNDKVDAGEIGAGHSVTALYEVQLTGKASDLGMVRIRAKTPTGTQAAEQAFPFTRNNLKESLDAASSDLRFAVAVAGTADILRKSQASDSWSLATAEKLAKGSTEGDADREEFVRLLGIIRPLWSRQYSVSQR